VLVDPETKLLRPNTTYGLIACRLWLGDGAGEFVSARKVADEPLMEIDTDGRAEGARREPVATIGMWMAQRTGLLPLLTPAQAILGKDRGLRSRSGWDAFDRAINA
jgi:hypothetical protein